jgi:hypothetical protein
MAMLGTRFVASVGDDLEATWDRVRSAPGAFGNIFVGVIRQVRLPDVLAFGVVLTGLVWLVVGYAFFDQRGADHVLISLTPLALWFVAGVVAGFIFHVGAVGRQSLAYWESYMLILLFGVFGVISLRLALDPRDRRVFHATAQALDGTPSGPASGHP